MSALGVSAEYRRGRVRVSTALLLACLVCLGATASTLTVGGGEARAATSHEYLPVPSEKITKGIPAGCGTGATDCLSGPLVEVNSMTVDGGHLLVAEQLYRGEQKLRRIDKFNGANGEFAPPQLDEENGVFQLEDGVAVGHAGGEEQVYVGAADNGQYVVAVYGPAGKLQPEGVWSGKNTPQGSFEEVTGVAVSSNLGSTLGDVYVADHGFVDVFPGEAGGKEPTKPIAQIAVNEAAATGTLTAGSTRIESLTTTSGKFVVEREIRGAGIPAGTVVTALTCTEGAEPCLEISQPATTTGSASLSAPGDIGSVAVSPINGDVFVAVGYQGDGQCTAGLADCVIDAFEPTVVPGVYNFLFTITGAPGEPFKRNESMTVDGEGDLYVAEGEANVIDQFDSTGKFLGNVRETSSGPFKSLRSVGVDPVTGDLYAGDYDKVQQTGAVDVFGPTRIVPDVTTTGGEAHVTVGVGGEGQIQATFEGTVNPLAQGPATCQFVLGTTTAFGQSAPCNEGVAEGNAPTPVKATAKEGLLPGTHYAFRLQATNKNGTNPGVVLDDKELVTPGPGLREEYASGVSATAATFGAKIDPNGAPTSYYFQYGKSSAYEAQAPAAPGVALGSAVGDVIVPPEHVQGLAPETLYHYRVVAVSQLQVQGGGVQPVSFAGPDQTFTTQQGLVGGQALPDGRRWELVSPPDKYGAVLEGNSGPGAIGAAADGDAVSTVATSPTEPNVKGTRGNDQVLFTRTTGGWSSQDLLVARTTPVSYVLGPEYKFLSSDLSSALVEPPEEFDSLSPEVFPQDTERGPYLRHNATCSATPGTCYQPLLVGCPAVGQSCATAVEEHADVPAGTKFGGDPNVAGSEPAETLDVTPDLAHMVLSDGVALTETSLTEGQAELYEVSPGNPPAQELRLVSLVPNEKGEEVPASNPGLGDNTDNIRHAMSDDGSRVVFSSGSPSGSHLYMRDLPDEKTVQLDLPQAQCVAEAECGEHEVSPQFQLATGDGARILFTDTQRLTKDAGRIPNEADLYQCEIQEIEGKPRCELSDLTPAPGQGQAADVLGAVIGASEGGSWIYFAANGVLGDAAQHGASTGNCREERGVQCHLYVYHEGAIHLIATLTGGDSHTWSGKDMEKISSMTARVSPNGQYLAFMSQGSLTGYDNRDAISGQPDQEVYLYHVESGGSGSLVCASCNPSGARPVGVEAGEISPNVFGSQVWDSHAWIASNIPGWTQDGVARAFYQTRYLANDGRLFFNSHDGLVAQDINDNEDVYEFEPAGVGDCSSASATFHGATGSCLALISSGHASGESAFLDASESGDDVFFLTLERLVPKDVDGSLDLYDAHVCSAEASCPEEVEAPATCVTADSCRPAPAPQPEIFGAPSSATFAGQGNLVAPPAVKGKGKAKSLTRAQKLARALKACHARRRERQRASCERKARKLYGPAPKSARKGSVGRGQGTSSKGGK